MVSCDVAAFSPQRVLDGRLSEIAICSDLGQMTCEWRKAYRLLPLHSRYTLVTALPQPLRAY